MAAPDEGRDQPFGLMIWVRIRVLAHVREGPYGVIADATPRTFVYNMSKARTSRISFKNVQGLARSLRSLDATVKGRSMLRPFSFWPSWSIILRMFVRCLGLFKSDFRRRVSDLAEHGPGYICN